MEEKDRQELRKKVEKNAEKRRRRRRRKNSALVWKLVMLVALAVFAISLWQLSEILINYHKADSDYDNIVSHMGQETVPVPVITAPDDGPDSTEPAGGGQNQDAEESGSTQSAEPEETEAAFVLTAPDFGYLQGVNGDVIGWIQIPGTKVNYPIVQGTDNEYYLTHTVSGEENASGAIFMDADITDGFQDKNPIIYGHNMKNGSMFSRLNRYSRRGFWDANRYIYITTPDGLMIYQVFSAYETAPDADIYYFGFGSDDVYQEYLDRIISYSIFDAGVTVTKEDNIVTLSTCANNTEHRFVVHAKRIQN